MRLIRTRVAFHGYASLLARAQLNALTQGLNDRNRVRASDGLRRNAVNEGRRRGMGVRRPVWSEPVRPGSPWKRRRAGVGFAAAVRWCRNWYAHMRWMRKNTTLPPASVPLFNCPRRPVDGSYQWGRSGELRVTKSTPSGSVVVVDQSRPRFAVSQLTPAWSPGGRIDRSLP